MSENTRFAPAGQPLLAKSQHILFILDRSGSMSSRAEDVIGGFNTYISEMKAEAAKDGLATQVSLVTFSDDHSVVFGGQAIEKVNPLSHETYRAMGNTALLDTVFDSVTKYRESVGQGVFAAPSDSAPPVLVIIFTDGLENASRKTTWPQVQELIQNCEKLGNWTFAYIGAHAGVWDQSAQLNVKRGNVLDAEKMTFAEAAPMVAESSKRYRAEYIRTGKKSSDDLFMPEAEPVPADTVR